MKPFTPIVALVSLLACSTLGHADPANPKESKEPPKLTDRQRSLDSASIDRAAVEKWLVGRSPVAAEGKDVVTLVEKQEMLDGLPDLIVRFDGQNYLFANEENKGKFEANPNAYAPILGGWSVVALRDRHELVPGKLDHLSSAGGRLYLFATAEEKGQFDDAAVEYQDFDVVLGGSSPVALVHEEMIRAGDKAWEVVAEGRRVRFASELERKLFLANPGKYFPTLGGLDIVSLGEGAVEFGSPQWSVVYKNRLYTFARRETRDRFLAQADDYADLDVAADGNDPVVKMESGKDQAGHYGISTLYLGKRYLFTNEDHRHKFMADPASFLEGAGAAAPINSAEKPAEEPAQDVPAPPVPAEPASDADPNVVEPVRTK